MIAILKIDFIYCYRYTLSFPFSFIVNQNVVFTFPFPFSLPFPGYCGLAFRDACVRPASVMTAGREEQWNVVRCWAAERAGGQEIHRRTSAVYGGDMLCSLVQGTQLIPRETYIIARRCSTSSLHPRSLPLILLLLFIACSFSKLSITSPTSQLILQPFPRFTYVTAPPTLPLLHLRHSSFSNPSFASSTSQDFHLRHLTSRPWRTWKIWNTDINSKPLLGKANLMYILFNLAYTWQCKVGHKVPCNFNRSGKCQRKGSATCHQQWRI